MHEIKVSLCFFRFIALCKELEFAEGMNDMRRLLKTIIGYGRYRYV